MARKVPRCLLSTFCQLFFGDGWCERLRWGKEWIDRFCIRILKSTDRNLDMCLLFGRFLDCFDFRVPIRTKPGCESNPLGCPVILSITIIHETPSSDSLLPTRPFLLTTIYLCLEGLDLVLKRLVGLLLGEVSTLPALNDSEN